MSAEVTKLPDATQLAIERTRLAHERTLMAWVRTAVSLISFGFTIYKFFQYLVEQGGQVREHTFGPRRYGMLMIGIGLISLIFATVQHWHYMRVLRSRTKEGVYSLAAAMAALVAILGIVSLVLAYFRE